MKQKYKSAGMLALFAGIITFLAYIRALSCEYVNFSDPDYVLDNQLIRSFDWNMIVRAFREPHVGWWMPLTWISFAFDYSLWGLNPFGYHLTNILLHCSNTGLVVLIANKILLNNTEQRCNGESLSFLLKWKCHFTLLIAGLLWGIHPLRVESVVWVVERKDVLNGLFSLSSALAYLCYVERKKMVEAAWPFYLISLALFACSLMAKSISVVLPLMLLVLDRYPLDRLQRESINALFVEKMPFFCLSALMTLITIRFAGNSSFVVLISNEMFPLYERILVSGNALMQYVRYMLLPAGITPYHVIPDPVPLIPYFFSTVIVIVFSALLLWILRGKQWVSTTWLLFVIPLLPVLALLQNGDQGYAARFTYLPSVAPCIMVSAYFRSFFADQGATSAFMRRAVFFSFLVLLAGYSVMSYRLIQTWDNGGTMWTRAIAHAPSSAAYWRRAMYNYSAGNYRKAADDYTAAINLVTPGWRPFLHNYYAHRGEALIAAGNLVEAVADLTAAIDEYPHPAYYRIRGEALRMLGREQESAADLMRTSKVDEPLGWYFEPSQKMR